MAEKKKYTEIDLSKYNSGYQASDYEKEALAKKTNYASQVDNWQASPYARENDLQSVINERLNRKKFSYDLNGDALYQQYKDNYITQGKQASMDVMGQAAAMTGGYGNSYAQTVGQQTYQGYLQGLNDKIPELYQLALNRYNAEGSELDSKYGLLSTEKAQHQTEQEAELKKLISKRDYYGTEANNARTTGFAEWDANRTYDTSQYWNEYNTGLQEEQLEWEMSKPVSVDYAISNYSDIPKNIRSTLDDFVSLAANEDFVGPLSKKQTDGMLNKVNVYISGLVNSGQMSPAVGDALMAEYVDIIEKR